MALTAKEWRLLEAKLADLEPAVRQAFIEAIQRRGTAVDVTALTELIDAGRFAEALEMVRVPDSWVTMASEEVRAAYIQGGASAGDLLAATIRAKFGFGMNARAEDWARTMSSRMIESVNENLPEVQGYIEQSVGKGIPARAVALDIVGRMDKATKRRTGGLLGLNSNQTGAAIRAKAELEDLDPAYFERKLRDKRFDSIVRRAIKDGKPLSRADLDRITGRYRDRLLKHRGDVIARTEALNALRAGQHEGFRQLIDAGLADAVEVKWQATADGRTRDSHLALNGQAVEFGQMFISPATGALMEFPGDISHGAHGEDVIQCRCVAIYRIKNRDR
ncbi:MAG: hypothetical protein E6R03_02765 [Hyphomicrobiaceae bacterium]|nr:MAG: hypothetical protein E6R03_02765 [Hyphomicrobiaceae bacterium]